MHLHCHSWFSLRYGLMQPRELLAEAQTAGITALALTDINATSAHWDFVRDAPEYGIRPVLGIDFRNASTDRDPAGTPLYIGYARNNTGYANLCAHLNAHLHVHRPFEPVAPALEHTFIVYPWARWKHTRPPLRSNEYIGVRPWEQAELRLLEGAADVPHERLVALHTFTFRHKRDWNCHRILRAVDRNELLSKLPETATGHPYDRLLSPADFHQAFAEHPHWVERAEALLNACEIALPDPRTAGRTTTNTRTPSRKTRTNSSSERCVPRGWLTATPTTKSTSWSGWKWSWRSSGSRGIWPISSSIGTSPATRAAAGTFTWGVEAGPTASSPTCCASRTWTPLNSTSTSNGSSTCTARIRRTSTSTSRGPTGTT